MYRLHACPCKTKLLRIVIQTKYANYLAHIEIINRVDYADNVFINQFYCLQKHAKTKKQKQKTKQNKTKTEL